MVYAGGSGGAPGGKRRLAHGESHAGQRRLGREGTRRFRRLEMGACVAVLALLAAAGWPALPARAHHTPYCYVVGDNSNNERVLSRVTKTDGSELTLGPLGTRKTDGIGMHPNTGVLYGIDTNMSAKVGTFGTINLSTGAFSAIGNGIGIADGTLGAQELYDASGFSFDVATGILYATQVRTGSDTAVDLLYQVNISTGRFVSNAFDGDDYVVMPKLPNFPQFHDIDDIAIDPLTGQMYGILNNSTNGDRLIKIDKLTGATTDVGSFNVAEVEGLDFDPHGGLWAMAGGEAGTEANKLYEVNKDTGAASHPRLLDNAVDYEALACMTGGVIANPTPTQTSPPPTPFPDLTERLYLPLLVRN